MARLPFEARFWSQVQKSDGCWEWTGGRNEKGYGLIWHEGRTYRAHRIAYRLVKGPVPDDMLVCHTCDNPPCVNPDHLFLGTSHDNVWDSINKGRFSSRPGVFRGRRGPGSRGSGSAALASVVLTAEDVRAIRLLAQQGQTHRALAARYGVRHSTIFDVVHRRTWRDI